MGSNVNETTNKPLDASKNLSDVEIPSTALANIGGVPTSRKVNGHDLTGDVTVTASDTGAVPTTRQVNGKALSADITLSASDVSAVPTTRQVNGKALSADVTLTASDVSAVPTTRAVNGKALSGDITLGLASADFANQGTTTTVLHGNGSGNPSFGAVVEADITLADNTTNDVSTTKHGLTPKAPNDTSKFLRGDATWAAPSSVTFVSPTTFTPTITSSNGADTIPVFTTNTGRYTRIGNTVFADVYLDGDGGAEGNGYGQIRINLPVTAGASHPTEYFECGRMYSGAGMTGYYPLFGQIQGSATYIELYYLQSGNFNALAPNNFSTPGGGRTIRLKFFYEV